MPSPQSAKADFPKFQPPVSTGGRSGSAPAAVSDARPQPFAARHRRVIAPLRATGAAHGCAAQSPRLPAAQARGLAGGSAPGAEARSGAALGS
jgi:hypothetical protein